MKTRKSGGMVEFLPTPSERKDGLIRDHIFELLDILDGRLGTLEEVVGIPKQEAERFRTIMTRIQKEFI